MLIWLILMLRMVDSDADYEDNADDNWWRYFRWSWCWWNWSCNICNDAKVDYTKFEFMMMTSTVPMLITPLLLMLGRVWVRARNKLPRRRGLLPRSNQLKRHSQVFLTIIIIIFIIVIIMSVTFFIIINISACCYDPTNSSVTTFPLTPQAWHRELSFLPCVPLPNWGFWQAVNLQTLWQTSPLKLSIGRQPVSLLSTRQANDKLTTT